jgi:hypothetical protein
VLCPAALARLSARNAQRSCTNGQNARLVNPRGATGPHADVRRTHIAVPQVLHTKLKSFPSLEEISALADELQPFFSQTAVFFLPPSRQPIRELSTASTAVACIPVHRLLCSTPIRTVLEIQGHT